MSLRRVTCRRSAIALTAGLVIFAALPAYSQAIVQSQSFSVGGPGVAQAGRELTVKFATTNVSAIPGQTPDAIAGLTASSRTIKFNGDADSVETCTAALPKNGDAATCPKSSKVGSGKVSGILGTPGERADKFGALSGFNGKFTIYNYRHRRGEPARMVAVIKSTKPFAGVFVNLVVPVKRPGVVTIDIPSLSKLPPIIRKSYPKETQLVLSKISVNIAAPRRRHSTPFMWLRKAGDVDATLIARPFGQ